MIPSRQVVPVPFRIESSTTQAKYIEELYASKANSLVTVGHSAAIVEHLAFDTQYYGVSMGRIDAIACHPGDQRQLIEACINRAKQDGIDHLTARVPAGDVFLSQALTEYGFYLVDSLVTLLHSQLERDQSSKINPELVVDLVRDEDIPILVKQSETIYQHSRYFNDPYLSPEKSKIHIGEWISNDCRGRCDAVFVARTGGEPCGFVACFFEKPNDNFTIASYATIDLIAVFGKSQGKGVGSALVHAALNHYKQRTKRMFVGTQGGNRPALRLYQSTGFQVSDIDITYHWKS